MGGERKMEDATRDTRVMTPDEVAEALRVSRSHAYKLIRRLNAELEERGTLTVPGKVSRGYFLRRYGLDGAGDERL